MMANTTNMEEETINIEKPENQGVNREPDGTFKKGFTGNPAGRPKGKSLKEFWKQRFSNMTEEEKLEFSEKVSSELLYRMAEGNPQSNTDVTSGYKPLFNAEQQQKTREAIQEVIDRTDTRRGE